MAKCRSCSAPIVWVETEARDGKPGRKMPIDAHPNGTPKGVDDGNIVMTGQTTGDGTPIVRYVPKKPMAYVSHFATCEFADKHRRPK